MLAVYMRGALAIAQRANWLFSSSAVNNPRPTSSSPGLLNRPGLYKCWNGVFDKTISNPSPGISVRSVNEKWDCGSPGMSNIWRPSCSVTVTPVIHSIVHWSCCLCKVQCFTHLCKSLRCRYSIRMAILISQIFDTPVIELTSINIFMVKTSRKPKASLCPSTKRQPEFLPISLNIVN